MHFWKEAGHHVHAVNQQGVAEHAKSVPKRVAASQQWAVTGRACVVLDAQEITPGAAWGWAVY